MRLSHDDQMRALREASLADPTTGRHGQPVQLSREMIDDAIRRGPKRTDQREWTQRTQGGMKAFLRHARIVQNLPHFAKGQRE